MRVVELGAGTGVLSFFAARAGAAKVWCVELNPELEAAARENLTLNGVADRVEVIAGDAAAYVPPMPVDVVICEMLHVGFLREKQIAVISGFKNRYLETFGPPLPAFVPEGAVLAVQPVQQSWDFHGYRAPFVHFQDGTVAQPRTRELADPAVYLSLTYDQPLAEVIDWQGELTIADAGTLNAIRFVLKNLLVIIAEEGRSIDWLCNYMIVPLREPMHGRAGVRVTLSFSYAPGDPLDALVPLATLTPHS
jgi:type I protein arginine methyltransferase